jgi:hypothetical protein
MPMMKQYAVVGQSRKGSVVETITSTVVGFVLSWLLLWFLAAWLYWPNDVESNTFVTICFTALSLVRGYAIRRLFSWYSTRRWKLCKQCGDSITLDGQVCWICLGGAGKAERPSENFELRSGHDQADDSGDITATLARSQPTIFGNQTTEK